jgi:hypothetical protein
MKKQGLAADCMKKQGLAADCMKKQGLVPPLTAWYLAQKNPSPKG